MGDHLEERGVMFPLSDMMVFWPKATSLYGEAVPEAVVKYYFSEALCRPISFRQVSKRKWAGVKRYNLNKLAKICKWYHSIPLCKAALLNWQEFIAMGNDSDFSQYSSTVSDTTTTHYEGT